jgi:hypothetical protein
MVGSLIYHRRFNIPWWEVQYTIVGGSIYHGGRFNIPWWEVEYTMVGG